MSTLSDRAYELRELILEIALGAGTCHIASSLSIADIVAALYFDVMRPDAGDRFVLSKGHACSALYAALAMNGTLDRERLIAEYCRDGGGFGGLAERGVPGVEVSGGSLGHGLAIALGQSLSDRVDGLDRRTFCLVGDGELDEGSIWEAFALAGHLRLTGLTTIVDANGLQALGAVADIVRMEPLGARLETFGWEVREVDGHDLDALRVALAPATGDAATGRPLCVVARTIKGSGVDFMEGDYRWHYGSLRPHDRERAMDALARSRVAA